MLRIVTDSVASLPAAWAEEYGIDVLSLYLNDQGHEMLDATMDLDAFYQDIYSMIDNPPRSSQPSQADFEAYFQSAAEAGDQVLGIFISTGLSGTYDGALRACRGVAATHPDFEFRLIDSQSCGFDEAFVVLAAVQARREGKSLDECAQATLNAIPETRFLFTPESLSFLQKGGRIGGAAALLGNLIQLSPVLTVIDGHAESRAKVRTRKKACDKILSIFDEDCNHAGGYYDLVVHYIGDKEPALKWAREVIEPKLGRKVEVVPVSPVVGLHVGPAIGIAYRCVQPLEGKLVKQDLDQLLLRH